MDFACLNVVFMASAVPTNRGMCALGNPYEPAFGFKEIGK
jgi:hypothetical protein